MKRFFIALLYPIVFSLSGCSSLSHKPTPYIGQWTGDDTLTMGIMGNVSITRNTIHFGKTVLPYDNTAPSQSDACSALYTAQSNKASQTYTLTLHKKTCDYKQALNGGFLKTIKTLTVYMSKNPFGTKLPFANESKTSEYSKTPYLFIRTGKGSTDFRFTTR